MATHQNSIAIQLWDEQTCAALLDRSTAARYLHAYLEELALLEGWAPLTVLVEGHYVDRHYLDDFQDYYAVSFSTPKAACGRLHFFGRLTPEQLREHLERAFSDPGAVDQATTALSASYLGFVVRRPLAAARLGRTVLRTYPVDGRRHYQVVRNYEVNVAGLPLHVKGLAYQQQDRGAAVCASTALWSALQQVAIRTGHRTPTPSAITRAADSPFAASRGLEFAQMADAVSRLGYGADSFVPRNDRARFRAQLVACLNSNLPVVLTILRKRPASGGHITEGHAITVTGYSEPAGSSQVTSDMAGVAPLNMYGAAVSVIYVHDDNLGFHAHYELIDSGDPDEEGYAKLKILRGRSNKPPLDWWPGDTWDVHAALIPKPRKLRKGVNELFQDLIFLRPTWSAAFPGVQFSYSIRFDSGTAVRLAVLRDPLLDRTCVGQFQSAVAFPRHVGVISLFVGSGLALNVVLDATEVERDPQHPGVLAIVAPGIPGNTIGAMIVARLSQFFRCPVLLGRPIVQGTTPALPPVPIAPTLPPVP